MAPDRRTIPVPYAVLALLLAVWVSLGVWICFAAPYGSGTDESIRYVAFAAATNRWATEGDGAAYGIDNYYYPPLYFLLFAPFFGDEPAFTTSYPSSPETNAVLTRFNGGKQLVPGEFLRRVPPKLLSLYRKAKMISLFFGLGIIACVIAAVRRLFPGPDRPWLVLGATAPLLLLPQFLYYHTLVNNDVLVNVLCALAILSFIAAVQNAERGERAGARNCAIACAAMTGLGLFAKQSAIMLAPLLLALAFVGTRSGPVTAGGRRLAGALRRLLLLAAVCFAAGGWWLLRSALVNDLSGMRAQQTGHPWAFSHSNFSWDFFIMLLGASARNYIALFAGELFGIPDGIFALYLVLWAALGAAFVGTLFIRRLKRPSGGSPVVAHRLIWLMLAVTLATNLALFVVYNMDVVAPHGRLLFPSLVASCVFLALVLQTIAGGSRRLLVLQICLLLVCQGGLFLWTFSQRMVDAVVQREEKLVPLGLRRERPSLAGPLWAVSLEQPLLLPPGTLSGFRVLTARTSAFPQFGTMIHARLRTSENSSQFREHRFRPSRVGDNQPSGWTDVSLEAPLELRHETVALLLLDATAPWLAAPGFAFGYGLTPVETSPRLKPLVINGQPTDRGLALTAVYE